MSEKTVDIRKAFDINYNVCLNHGVAAETCKKIRESSMEQAENMLDKPLNLAESVEGVEPTEETKRHIEEYKRITQMLL